MRNQFDALNSLAGSYDTAQDCYDKLEKCLDSANNLVLSKCKPTKKQLWVSKDSEDIREKRDEAKAKYHRARNPKNHENWRTLAEETTRSYAMDKERYLENLCGEAMEAAKVQNTKQVYKIVRAISGKRSKGAATLVKKRDGTDPRDSADLLSEWRSYFNTLLNVPCSLQVTQPIEPALVDLPICTDDFSIYEVMAAIKKTKNGKAAGPDSAVTPEALKFAGDQAITLLQETCNRVLNTGKPPSQWLTNTIIPIPKKGNSHQMQNYRGITLMSIAAKIYNRMILDRIYKDINRKLRPNQAGFRRGMSCIEQINTIRRIMEGARDKNLPIIVTFVDFSKAFDSINREVMWQILRSYGIPQKIVNGIWCLYDNVSSRVQVDSQLSGGLFTVSTGVLQGDTLVPFLFIIVLDHVLSQISPHFCFVTHVNPEIRLTDLDFSDDISLLDGSISDMPGIISSICQRMQLK